MASSWLVSFKGSTDAEFFEDFIQQLLEYCGRWPEPKSVLVMDNASFHHSEQVKQLCSDAGVKLLYLPPYSPDSIPIEFFTQLEAYITNLGQHMRKILTKALKPSFDGVLIVLVQGRRVLRAIFEIQV